MRGGQGGGDLAAAEAAIVAHAREIDGRGVDLVWLAERPIGGEAAVPVAWPLAAALAASTTRLRIGVGPLPLPLVHPLRVAEDAATLDGISAGRFELAVGLGAHPEAFDAFGVPPAERVARFEDALALLRAAFGEGPIEEGGLIHDAAGIDLHPKPVQRPGPPLWIGATAPAAIARAARLGDGMLCQSEPAARAFVAARNAESPGLRPIRIALLRDAADDDASLIAAARSFGDLGAARSEITLDLVLCAGSTGDAPAGRLAGLARSLAALADSEGTPPARAVD